MGESREDDSEYSTSIRVGMEGDREQPDTGVVNPAGPLEIIQGADSL